jgi:hypothetical protein
MGQLAATGDTALFTPEFAQYDRCRVLFVGRFFGRFFRRSVIDQRFARRLFQDGTDELADVGQLRFLLDRLAVVIIMP